MRTALLIMMVFVFACSRSQLDDGDLPSSPGGSFATGTFDGSAQSPGTSGDDASEHGDSGTANDAGIQANAPDASPPPGPCGPFTCPDGCCMNGACYLATIGVDGVFPVDIPCGTNGEDCATCAAGETCIGGGCQRDLGETCTPANCAGCCLVAAVDTATLMSTSTQCFDGRQDNFCGSGGGQCERCTPGTNGGHCAASSPGGGHCEDVGVCNATNCEGCCLGKVCAVGSQNVACGRNGDACQDCTADGGDCTGITGADGGIHAVCAYDCLPDVPACTMYCASASSCFPATGPLPF